jgi:hypothetical protein
MTTMIDRYTNQYYNVIYFNYTNQYYNVIYFWSTTQINITMSYTFGHCHCKQSLNTIAVHIYMKVSQLTNTH